VCLRSGRTRNTYSGVSVVVNYTCSGGSNPLCNGNPTNSQFDFECVSSPSLQWGASVGGSSDNIVTTPPTGNFATTLRSDCGVCISPARSPFGTITNNEQHCLCTLSTVIPGCDYFMCTCVAIYMEVFVMSSVYLPCVYSCTQGTCAMRDCLPTVCVCVCRSFQPSLRRMMAYSESLR